MVKVKLQVKVQVTVKVTVGIKETEKLQKLIER